MIQILKSALFGLLLGALFSTWANAATRTAATCNASDVRAAMNLASAGDKVVIPAGTCTWTTQVSWTAPANVTLEGQTACGNGPPASSATCTDGTTIVDNYASNNALLAITVSSTGAATLRLTGITIKGGTGLVKQNGMVSISGTNSNTRVDHNHFNLATYGSSGQNSIGTRFTGWIYGVMDHNVCDDAGGVNECVNVWTDGYGGKSFGDGAWADVTSFGSANFMYVETNTFNSGLYADDCDDGGREVFRYNTVNSAQTQTHPTGGAPRFRGCRAKETYQNTFNGLTSCNGSSGFSNCLYNAVWLSSGTGLVWGNTFPVVNSGAGSGYQWVITAHSMRRSNSTYGQTATPNGWGYCGTSFNGTGSNWDENTSSSTGYACLDQPGRGKGDLLANDFPSAINMTTVTIAWPHQALEPVYEWLDSLTPVPNNPGGTMNNSSPDVLVQNQDFYLYTAGFNGTSGVGSGALTARPSTCTPSVAYWATDTNTLYQCSATNAWTAYYTPYTYPHPLTQGAQGPPPPAPPTGLEATSH